MAAADFRRIPARDQKGKCSTVERFLNLRSYAYLWRIPKHQRAYSWASSFDDDAPGHVESFYLDIEQAREDGYTHSLGTLDCTKSPTRIDLETSPRDTSTFYELAVNDGQQRLTTIFLCYAALAQIRDYSGDNSYRTEYNADPTREPADGAMVLNSGGAPAPRFGLQERALTSHFLRLFREGDAFAFNPGTVTGPVVTDENTTQDANLTGRLACQRMTKAYISLRKYLGSHANLDTWEDAFYKAELTWVESETPPHTLFEIRNSRGLPVRRLDQAKNWMMYLQDHWSAQGSPFQNPFTGNPIEASNLWWRAVGFLEEFTAKASAEDELLGHMRSVVDGMALGARKTDYTSFQSEYAISNTGLTAAGGPTDHRDRIVHTMLAMEWLAQSMGEIYRPHPDYSTFIFGSLATQMARGMSLQQRTEALVLLTDIVCRMDKKAVISTLLLVTYRYAQPGVGRLPPLHVKTDLPCLHGGS